MKADGKALVEHWNWAANKGLMNARTASVIRGACKQVLSQVFGDDWEEVDVRNMDVQDTWNKFLTLRKRSLKPQTLESYKNRFMWGVDSFLSYARTPEKWKPSISGRSIPPADNSQYRPEAGPGRDDRDEEWAIGRVDYRFPLREGLDVHLILPRYLTAAEARRLCAFITTLILDDEDPET